MKRLFLLVCLMTVVFAAQSKDYVITDFGAHADSTTMNTSAIQKVIDLAHSHGGGTIVIPKGTFLSGALFFKSHTRLRLEEGAELLGSDNISDYPLIPSRMEGRKLDYYAALINAYLVDSFSIKGPGKINGNGLRYWTQFWAYRDSLRKIKQEATNLDVHRPRLIFVWGCKNVLLRNVKLCNAGFWTTHLYQCRNVLIDHCDIRSPYKPVAAPSTDGVDIDVCKGVTIRNCYIAVNDDAVCVKGGKGPTAHKLPENGIVKNVLIEHCTFGPSHSTLTLGSECIHAKNITMRNCKVDNTCPVLKFKMRPDTYQLYENVTVENITGMCGSIINMAPWTQFFNLNGSKEKPCGKVRNITISNVKVKSLTFGEMQGNPNDSVSEIVFKDINVTTPKAAFKNKYTDVKMENVLVNGTPLQNQ